MSAFRAPFLLTGIALLSACSTSGGPAKTPFGPPQGERPARYAVTMPDGREIVIEIQPGGIYQEWLGERFIERGVVTIRDGKSCFDPDGPPPETCYAAGKPAGDGSFVSIDDKGRPWKTRPLP